MKTALAISVPLAILAGAIPVYLAWLWCCENSTWLGIVQFAVRFALSFR